MAEFMFVLRGDPKNWGTSEKEQEKIMNGFSAWVDSLGEHYQECARLRPKMARVSAVGNSVSVDGPFTETKELFSGIFRIEATDFDKAVALARTCPMLQLGEDILVMPVWARGGKS